jgi:hypothetical protein
MAGAVLAATVVALAGPAEAGAINVVTATGVGIGDFASCGIAGTLAIEGTGTGGPGGGEALQRGTASTLFDDDANSFALEGTNYGPGDFAFDYGVPLDQVYPEGTIVGLYAAVGDVNEDPQTFGEWFILYRCATDPAESELLYSCFGALGDCPANAAAAQIQQFEVEVSDAAPDPGETLTAVGSGCFGDAGSLRLVEGTTVLDESDGIPVDADGTIVADLTVPASATPGTELEVIGECYLEDTLIGDDGVAVIVAGQVPTTTVAPTTIVRPTTPVARPVALTPAFTG